jgi:Phage tail lysozyme
VPLADPISRLSDEVVKLVKDFSESGTLKKWVDDLADGIRWLDKEIGTDDFHNAMMGFVKGVGDAGDKIKAFLPDLETFGEIVAKIAKAGAAVLGPPLIGRPDDPNNPLPNDRTPGNSPGIPPFDWRDPTTYDLWQRMFQKSAFRTTSGDGDTSLPGVGGGPRGNVDPASKAQLASFIQSLGFTSDQTGGFLDNLVSESKLNPAAYNPAGGGYGAQGIGQWRGERVEQYVARYGHQPRYGSLEEQEDFIRWELNNTEKAAADRLHAARNRNEATAAVNEGYERSATPSSARYGAAGSVPRSGEYAQTFNGSRGITLKVENLTGGAVAISAAQLAV